MLPRRKSVPDDKLARPSVEKRTPPAALDWSGRESEPRRWDSPLAASAVQLSSTFIAIAAVSFSILRTPALFAKLSSVLIALASICAWIAVTSLLVRIRQVQGMIMEAKIEYESRCLWIASHVETDAIAVMRKEIDELEPMAPADRMRLELAANYLIEALFPQAKNDTP
jgi:hypothetical protein